MRAERAEAFAPGRVNLIGEHTDYNGGQALPFAIREGVRVLARAVPGDTITVHAATLGERDEFPATAPPRASGWRAYVRGVAGELAARGIGGGGIELEIEGDVPTGAGLSSSAALEVSLCLALIELDDRGGAGRADPVEIARLCAGVEQRWAGAQTGLLDQLASLCGQPDAAVLIDFRTLAIDPVPMRLGGWRLAVLDSGERHAHASSGYNERRAECAAACELLGVALLSEASREQAQELPEPLRERALHVLGENTRVADAAGLLLAGELPALGSLLDASHASLRDLYEVSTPAVESAVARMREAGAAGARLVGGGFGGSVLGLFAPGVPPPPGAREVRPGPGARVLAG